MIYRLLSRNSINIGVFTMFPYKPGQCASEKIPLVLQVCRLRRCA